MTIRIGSICTGIGGLDLGLMAAGFGEPAWMCEAEPSANTDHFEARRVELCRRVLARRFPGVPVHGDLRTIRGQDVAPTDMLVGGPPCQPVSMVGMRLGEDDPRWLWGHVLRLVGELRPAMCLFENPVGILKFLPRILADIH